MAEHSFSLTPSRHRAADRLDARQSVLLAVGVGAAYYAGAQLGLALTFPPTTTSVLWPPNATVTSALLLVPTRSWWVCLAAAFPAHAVLETGAGFSPLLVALLFLTNCSEAVVAAGGLRLASDAAGQFDTLRRVALFIAFVVLLGPIVSSFADAAVVSTLRGESYWHVWRTRMFANALTELAVVPAAVLGLRALGRRRWPSTRRILEAGLLLLGLVLCGALVFGDLRLTGPVPGLPRTPTVLVLPLFFWATIRFGVGGVSTALLACAFVASVSTAIGHRPFGVLPPLESLMAVEMYLAMMGIPLMCLAGVLAERRQATADLAERLRFEGFLAQVTASLLRPVHAAPSLAYDDYLGRVAEFLHVDRVVLLAVGPGPDDDDHLWSWGTPASASGIAGHRGGHFPWTRARVAAGQTLVCESIEALSADAASDRDAYHRAGVGAFVVVPLVARSAAHDALGVGTREPRVWRPDDVTRIRLLAEVLSNARTREQAEVEVQRTRLELAQMARLASMGELASSLAHELNQPLTGILCNAQAARRLLDGEAPPLGELRAIVADIIDDDRRAGEVIRRLREMLARADTSPAVLDVNTLVRDVIVLIASDTIIRNVSVRFNATSEPVHVLGARVDLQQAVLNVIVNAMDAVAERRVADRLVDVRVGRHACEDVEIAVNDSGHGLAPGTEGRVFDPFFSMKPSGMGLGLSVARSIVESHGGLITAANSPAGGAVITIRLPGARELAAV